MEKVTWKHRWKMKILVLRRVSILRPVARGGSGGSYDPPPQLPIPKILFHPLAILFHLSAILFHPLAILFHPSAILFHPLAILFHPSAILFHPLAILFHPWNMWMTSHGQCPRGGGCLWMSKSGGRFSNWWRHADNVQGGGGACECPRGGVRLVFHPSKFRPPPPPGWLATGLILYTFAHNLRPTGPTVDLKWDARLLFLP